MRFSPCSKLTLSLDTLKLRASIISTIFAVRCCGFGVQVCLTPEELCRVADFHGIAVDVSREAAEDVVVNNTLIPKGTTVMLLPGVIQHNPRIWGEDADEFNPDRWEAKTADAHAFAAFFQGPRQCIGRVFAMIEFKVTLIEVVSKFIFEPVEGSGIHEDIVLVNPSPLLRPSGGLKARVRRL